MLSISSFSHGGAPRCILYFKTHPLSSSIASLIASIARCDGRQRCLGCKRVKCVKRWQCHDRKRLETRFSTLTHVYLVDIQDCETRYYCWHCMCNGSPSQLMCAPFRVPHASVYHIADVKGYQEEVEMRGEVSHRTKGCAFSVG